MELGLYVMTTYFDEVLAKVDTKTAQTVLQRLQMGAGVNHLSGRLERSPV